MQKTALSNSALPGRTHTFVAKVEAEVIASYSVQADVEIRFVAIDSLEVRFTATADLEL